MHQFKCTEPITCYEKEKQSLQKENLWLLGKALWISGSPHITLEHNLLNVCFASSSLDLLRWKEEQKASPALSNFLSQKIELFRKWSCNEKAHNKKYIKHRVMLQMESDKIAVILPLLRTNNQSAGVSQSRWQRSTEQVTSLSYAPISPSVKHGEQKAFILKRKKSLLRHSNDKRYVAAPFLSSSNRGHLSRTTEISHVSFTVDSQKHCLIKRLINRIMLSQYT